MKLKEEVFIHNFPNLYGHGSGGMIGLFIFFFIGLLSCTYLIIDELKITSLKSDIQKKLSLICTFLFFVQRCFYIVVPLPISNEAWVYVCHTMYKAPYYLMWYFSAMWLGSATAFPKIKNHTHKTVTQVLIYIFVFVLIILYHILKFCSMFVTSGTQSFVTGSNITLLIFNIALFIMMLIFTIIVFQLTYKFFKSRLKSELIKIAAKKMLLLLIMLLVMTCSFLFQVISSIVDICNGSVSLGLAKKQLDICLQDDINDCGNYFVMRFFGIFLTEVVETLSFVGVFIAIHLYQPSPPSVATSSSDSAKSSSTKIDPDSEGANATAPYGQMKDESHSYRQPLLRSQER